MEITENLIFNGFILLVVILILYKCFEKYNEKFSNIENLNYMFYRPPSSYIANTVENKKPKEEERQVNYIFTRPNKCFSCERQMVKNYARKYINLAFPGKCISCEKEAAKMGRDPYHEGPTKCFSCIKN